jgi:hypothetical protein
VKSKWCFRIVVCVALLLCCALLEGVELKVQAAQKVRASVAAGRSGASKSWFFAVSGDSRDCGDLIMPKIAWSIEHDRLMTPVDFYWHLGDLRGMYRIDCDYLKRKYPDYDCKARPPGVLTSDDTNDYLKFAWDDFIEHQISPFSVPFYLGIGNHELINRTREDFQCRFKKWLTQAPLLDQVRLDTRRGINSLADNTYYHFIKNGVDFIYLDNAGNDASFSPEQLAWLAQVLAQDAKNDSVKTIIAGMHAALPQSSERGHAMDATCAGFCSGLQAYDMLYNAQALTGPVNKRKHVYVFASHSHFFKEYIYDTPEHKGKVLPGWIIGTGGAEQYRSVATDPIQYGYMQVEILPTGDIATRFREVGRETPPLATGTGAAQLTSFCFEQNRSVPRDNHKTNCTCGVVK